MSLRDCIFDGHHEKELYRHLASIWQRHFNIYPQLPFTKIFDIDTLNISSKERDFLLKTNIDYTICDKKDRQLTCIEFDGLSHGYNKGGEYIQVVKNPLRKRKLDLKLRIATEHNFPFYIISYDEEKPLSENIHLTVLDCIIGQTVAKLRFNDKMKEYLKNSEEELNSMNAHDTDEFIQDLIFSADVDLELTWDPIARKAARMELELSNKGIMTSYGYRHWSVPELPEPRSIYDLETVEKRVEAFEYVEWWGCEVYCNTPKGKITEKAMIRNFEGMHVWPLTIVKHIAMLLALHKVARLNEVLLDGVADDTGFDH